MSNYNARVPADKQYQLIMECRSSGLTDFQWCKEHGIHPGTFYNWVSRLRKKACREIPESISKAAPSPAQDVVRLNFNPKAERPESMFPVQPALEDPYRIPEISASIEMSLGSATIRIANGADPAILDRVLSLVRGTICQAISPWRTTSISCAAQLICASPSMVSAALSGINFLWTQTSPPCSCSVGNDVTGLRSCSTNQMDMFSFIKG